MPPFPGPHSIVLHCRAAAALEDGNLSDFILNPFVQVISLREITPALLIYRNTYNWLWLLAIGLLFYIGPFYDQEWI